MDRLGDDDVVWVVECQEVPSSLEHNSSRCGDEPRLEQRDVLSQSEAAMKPGRRVVTPRLELERVKTSVCTHSLSNRYCCKPPSPERKLCARL
jgi:hypothetical protein